MSSVVIKLGSLVIKTLSKPIATKIKEQARQHERFRQLCIRSAQAIHQWDMRFKLGLLQDSATQEKQAKREAAEAQAAKHKHEIPTVKTEAQTLEEEEKLAKEKEREERGEKKQKETAKPKVKIRPLSEAKAIDSGANFVSETFLLMVGVALILGENWRQSRKQKSRREDVAERLEELEVYEKSARRGLVEMEKEVLRLRGENLRLGGHNQQKGAKQQRILPPEVYELEEKEEKERKMPEKQSWWEWVRWNTVGDLNNEDLAASDGDSKSRMQSLDGTEKAKGPAQPSASILWKLLPSSKESGQHAGPSHVPDDRREDSIASPASRKSPLNKGWPSEN